MSDSHLKTLERWPRFAKQYWWDDPERPELGCFGTGYNSWGVQTNQKYLGAYAVLAADPRTDEQAVGMSREAVLDRALRALRFSLASHVSGDHHCSDGTQWGHTWISGLGIERMMHGLQAIDGELSDADREGVLRVMCSEADWLLGLPTQGTLWAKDGGNKPESNIWNGAICARAAAMAPDHRHAGDWLEKAHLNLLNGISTPADALDETIIAGKPLREWHVGPNFFPNYALDHHGYLNVGYMVICLSNIAMLHYWFALEGLEPPESLYHHAADLWQVVRQFTFEDGRLARIGGDSRQRYSYCQDYLLPTLVFCADYFGDTRAAKLEAGALGLIRQEQAYNDDGSFLSKRLETIRGTNPYYYTRLEADKAVVLSMNAYWRRRLEERAASDCRAGACTPPGLRQTDGGGVQAPALQSEQTNGGGVQAPALQFSDQAAYSWQEPEHGAMLHRSPRRLASWSWRANEAPQGLCLPPDRSDLAEWCENMGGVVRLAGEQGRRTVLRHWQQGFEGGFVTVGTMADSTKAVFGEGWTGSDRIPHHLAVAALPDDRTMLVLEHCRASTRVYLNEVKGLKLNVPNDLFNGFRRRYFAETGEIVAEGREQRTLPLRSRWANVEGAIGVVGIYGAEELALFQAGQRRAAGYADSLYYDELCFTCRTGLWDESPGAVLLDCGSMVLSGASVDETRAAAGQVEAIGTGQELVRAVRVQGADGKTYVLVANFGDEATAGPGGETVEAGQAVLAVV